MNNMYEDGQIARATILIVEDHEPVRRGLRDWLSIRFPGCRILAAGSGEEAVTLVCAHSPDIVLMDIGLPQMNGIEATRYIKAVAPQVHVVILTIRESFEYEAAALKAGADQYIAKLEMGTKLIPVLAGLLGLTSETGYGEKDNP
jgi:DNA-binding NarL/FixJ family response regulator